RESKFNFIEEFETTYKLPPEALLELGAQFYRIFKKKVSWTLRDLELIADSQWKPYVFAALAQLAATRTAFQKAVEKWGSSEPTQLPYDLNPLLWKPIIKIHELYYAPYPELIAYAVTKGLFFTCGSQWKPFATAFGSWFEQHTGQFLQRCLA